jgi:uncharacterized protein (DUF302 family)
LIRYRKANLIDWPITQPFFSTRVYRGRIGRSDLSEMEHKQMTADGLVSLRSSSGPKDTTARLDAEVKARGMTIFARIDHAAGAAEVGLSLRPTELLIFGNARGGTPLMQSIQTVGIDLPLKALVWQDETGDTWVSYNDPVWLARRHGLDSGAVAAISAMAAALDAIAKAAAAAP